MPSLFRRTKLYRERYTIGEREGGCSGGHTGEYSAVQCYIRSSPPHKEERGKGRKGKASTSKGGTYTAQVSAGFDKLFPAWKERGGPY